MAGARRADVSVRFAGVDITQDLKPYLLSLSYTDNEEGEADDLTIQIEDRDGTWMRQWLNDAIQNAASQYDWSQDETNGAEEGAAAEYTAGGAGTYMINANVGLNMRSGPSTDYASTGAVPYGQVVTVTGFDGDWAVCDVNGKQVYMYAQYLEPSTGAAGTVVETTKETVVQATIVAKNWDGDSDKTLDCGVFALDTIKHSGPPATCTIKCTSLPFSSTVIQTKKSKAWEGYNLRGIASEIASTNGLGCMYESDINPEYERVEQITKPDITFLQSLCQKAGLSLKATNNCIVIFDQAKYEQRDEIMTIEWEKSGYTSWALDTGEADTEFASCRVSYTTPSGDVIEGFAYIEDYNEEDENNQQLEVTAYVESAADAAQMAKKYLRLHNKFEKSASFTFPGNPDLCAGCTVVLSGFGLWDGKYMITQAKHSIGGSYTTQVKLRRILEGI